MIRLQSEIEIDAPDHVVWAVLTDFRTYPEWTGWKGTISGDVRTGAWLKVVARPRRGKVKVTFFRVIRVVGNRELRWNSSYVPLGLLSGQRYWVLQRLDAGRTRLIQGEAFSGPLLGLFRRKLNTEGPLKYDQMCQRLKAYCEMVYSTAADAR